MIRSIDKPAKTILEYQLAIGKLEKMLWHKQQLLDWLGEEAPTEMVCRRIQSAKMHYATIYQQLQELEEEYQQRFN